MDKKFVESFEKRDIRRISDYYPYISDKCKKQIREECTIQLIETKYNMVDYYQEIEFNKYKGIPVNFGLTLLGIITIPSYYMISRFFSLAPLLNYSIKGICFGIPGYNFGRLIHRGSSNLVYDYLLEKSYDENKKLKDIDLIIK